VRPQVQAPEPVLETKSYFLRDLFSRVMFPDQDVAVRSAAAEKREGLRRWIAVGAAAAVGLVLLALPFRAFLLNRELVLSTAATVDAVAAQLRQARAGGQPPVDRLEPLRVRLYELVAHAEAGPPWAMRFGMYQGGELLPHLRTFHAQATRRLVLDPIFKQDVGDMDAFVARWERTESPPPVADHARFYDLLKMHLLLTAPRGLAEPRLDDALAAWIGERVAERWQARWSLGTEPAAALHLASNANLFVRVLASDPALALPRHEELVRRMRRILSRVPLSALALERLAAEVDGKGLEVTLQTALGGPVPSLRSTARVRGAYTRRGFEESMKERLESPGALLELWVLASDPKELEAVQERETQRLRSRYFGRYIEEWRRFAESIEPVGGGGSQATLSLLQDLTRGEPPPYARIFRTVGYNTRIAGAAGALQKAAEGVLEKIRGTLAGPRRQALEAGLKVDREEALLGPVDVELSFAGFVEFGYAGDPAAGGGAAQKNLPLDVYQEQIGFVRDALQTAVEGSDTGPLVGRVTTARTRVRSLLDTQPVGWRPTLERLLWPPIEWASASTAREAAAGASQKWCSMVALPWKRNLASRYPFVRDGDDAALADVGEFFRPGNGLVWGFYAEALRNDVQRQGDGFAFARQLGGTTGFSPSLLPFLRQAQEVTTVLFPSGAAEPKVPFAVRIRPTPRVASVVLEVDGQRFEYFNGPEEWRKMTWPAQGRSPGALLRVRAATGREEILQQDGEWGLFRLLEAGQVRGEPGPRDFTVAFDFPALGVTIVVDFRPDRSEAPFFGVKRGAKSRLLAPFRSGIGPPMVIGKGAPSCG
jgi:type VI secretion system protein ImpL